MALGTYAFRVQEPNDERRRRRRRETVPAQRLIQRTAKGDFEWQVGILLFASALLHKSSDNRGYPFLGRPHPTASVTRYAERGEAVQDGHTDLELSNLTVEVPRHEALAQEFHTVHLRFDAASAVISTPSSPDGSAEAFRRA